MSSKAVRREAVTSGDCEGCAARRTVLLGLLSLPAHFDFVLGVPGALAAKRSAVEYLKGELRIDVPATLPTLRAELRVLHVRTSSCQNR